MIRYVPPSPAELLDIATSSDMDAAIEDSARAGMEYARSIAPVDTGAYRDSFGVDDAGPGEALVVNDDEGAAAIESGSDDTPAHNVLSQTVDWLERS